MKKYLIVVVLTVIAFSCQKQKLKGNSHLSSFTKEVISQNDPVQLRYGYELMSNKERQDLWLTKYDAILENDADSLTIDQIAIIDTLKNFIEKYGMDSLVNNPIIGENFLSTHLASFSQHFSDYQIFLIIEHPYYVDGFTLFKMRYDDVIYSEESSSTKCNCRYSVSCGWTKTCNEGEYWKCTKVTGCGVFGTANCTGVCG